MRTDKQKLADMSRMLPLFLFQNQSDDDVIYEQDIIRDPMSVRPWLTYIEYKQQSGSVLEQAFVSHQSATIPRRWPCLAVAVFDIIANDDYSKVMERACRQLPRSYKLWKMVSPCLAMCYVVAAPVTCLSLKGLASISD